jgi:phosphonoacetaldehyde hydrolase
MAAWGPPLFSVDVFKAFDIAVSVAEARQFMGLEKKQHVRRMCQLPEVATQWEQRYGRMPMKTMWRRSTN